MQAYLPADEKQKQELEKILEKKEFSEVKTMNQTVYDQGIEKGIEQGIEKGRREGRQQLVEELLQERFGAVSEETRARLASLSTEELRRLALKIGTASSAAELGLPG